MPQLSPSVRKSRERCLGNAVGEAPQKGNWARNADVGAWLAQEAGA